MFSCSRCTLLALPFLVAAFASGCDTGNPSSPLDQLEGVYAFTELRFDPTAQAIDDADVLAMLVEASTNVEVFGSGRALVRFKYENEPSDLADADFSATGTTARLTARSEDDAARLAQILMPGTVILNISQDGQRLTGSVANTVNLQAFDPTVYQGLTQVQGTLYIGLARDVEE
ncbi:MAG: hypothetical protein R3284_05365 [Rubricoccaceae bacterium]|nr:hypothetical protein [Rubricoccaceae bacterium]